MTIEDRIRAEVMKAGVPLFGIIQPSTPVHYLNFLAWIESSNYAGMSYLARPDAVWKREHPTRIMPETRSILIFGFPYPKNLEISSPDESTPLGRIASYAWIDDYHQIIPGLLQKIMHRISEMAGREITFRTYTDTGPLLEKDLAQQAGLGWIGKNTCLIAPNIGSYFFLAEVLTDLSLAPSETFKQDLCGACERCIEACPTQCISRDTRTIEASRCISYLTIENRGSIPNELRSMVGDWVFGCDVCQMVCPWNQKTPRHQPIGEFLTHRQGYIDLHQTIELSLDEFTKKYQNTPIFRAKRTGLMRNAACSLGNIQNLESIPHLVRLMEKEADPFVRRHAAWALGQFNHPGAREFLEKWIFAEKDEMVRAEIYTILEN